MRQAKPNTVASLFRDEPRRWGLRGDPFLWTEMAQHLAATHLPESSTEFVRLINDLFVELTGHSLSHPDPFFVERYSHGGMSSGHVCPEFWRDEAVPLLLGRYNTSAPGRSNSVREPEV